MYLIYHYYVTLIIGYCDTFFNCTPHRWSALWLEYMHIDLQCYTNHAAVMTCNNNKKYTDNDTVSTVTKDIIVMSIHLYTTSKVIIIAAVIK